MFQTLYKLLQYDMERINTIRLLARFANIDDFGMFPGVTNNEACYYNYSMAYGKSPYNTQHSYRKRYGNT